jgi:diguanylate cyclase (GGDEF)-like protein
VCRFGGEEFAVLMPGIGADDAITRIDGVRHGFQGRPLDDRDPDLVDVVSLPTLSGGVAEVPSHAVELDGLMRAADRALYRAKAGGRDRVEVAKRTAAALAPEATGAAVKPADGVSTRDR